MPNPLDHLYDELKVKYPDFVDRGEFVSKLSNEDELKKLHQAASQSFKGFVGFDDFKNKVGESLSTYDTDSDYRTQNTASTEQKSAEADNTASQREESRPAPSEPQNSGISSEAYIPAQPGQPTDTHVEAEPFDRETGDLDELDRRYQEKVKRLEGYGATEGLYANEEAARKHYEAYSRLLDEAEQDRLVYNRRVKAAEDERAEQQRQLDLQSKDRKTRRSAEYGGYTNDQVRKEQERLKKERAYLEDPKSKRNADYSKRVMEYNADQTALSAEADKRNKSYERKRAMYDEVKTIAEDPDVQKRITGNDTVAYVLSGNNPYALQSINRMAERAKTMTDEELFDTCKTIAWQKYARGYDRDIYAPLAGSFLACYNELMYRMGGDEPKSAMEMRYDMIDKATEGTPEGDNFMLGLRNYLDGTAGMGTANYETDDSERANIPQFAIADYYKNLVFEKGQENIRKADQRSRYPLINEGELDIIAAATDINYDEMLQQAYDKFGEEKLRAYIVAHALHNGISIDESAQRVNQSIWNATIGKEIEGFRPKSNLEFFVRRIFSDNMFSKLVRLGIRGRNGNMGGTDPFAIDSMVLDEYAKEHPGWDTAAVVTNFAVMEGPIFSAYGKLASGLVGVTERAILGAALKTTDRVAIEATAKTLSQSLMYRLAKGGATGALVGFQYGTMSGAIDQAYYNGDVDFGKVIANGGHMMRDFALMHVGGELFGVTGDAILRRGQRNLRNGQGALRNRIETTSLHFLNSVAKTATNASIVTGLYAAIDKPALERENKKIEAENKKIEAENARLPEDQQKPLKPLNQIASVEDTFYSSLRMFAGLDAVGMLRSAWSIGVRGQYERNKHVKIHFDKFDREALEKAFGKNPNSLLRQIVFGNVDGVPAKWFEIDPEAEQEIYNELGRELTPAEKEAYATYGFTELRKIILNKDIPWATRAKIVSVVTGRVVQEPPVAKATIDFVMDSSGTIAKRIIVKSIDLEGNVIQAREFDGQREFEAARSLYEALNDRGWRNNAMLCGDLVIDAIEDKTYADTVDEMAREKGIAPEQFEQMVFGIKQKDITGEKVTYQERQLVDEFDKRHQEKQDAEIKLTGPDKLIEQIAREVFGADWKQAKNIPFKSWGEMTEAEKEFVNKYIERMGAMGVAERNKLMNANPDWVRTAKEYEESVRRRMEEAERPAEAEPLPALEDEKVSVETPVEERVEPVPEVIELEEEKPAEPEPVKEETPAEEPVAEEKPDTEGQPQAGTIGFEPVEQPTERERFDAERKEKAATITDADIEANREALGIPEGTALTDEARQIYAEDLAEDLMRYERFKRGESDEKARFHDYWESKFNPKRPKLEKPAEKQEEPVEEEDFEEEEEEVTEADTQIEQFDNLKGRSDLERYRNALKVFAGDDEIMAILEDLEPHDITEWVSSFLGLDSGKGYSMLWESKTRGGTVIAKGFKEETGWSWNDVKGFAFMFDNKNGMSPRRVAEKIWEELPSGIKDKYSDVDVFNIMMDLFKSSSRKSDLTNYIRNNRMEQVRELLNRRRSEELADIARYKERERRGDEEPVAPPVSDDEEQNEFAVREDDVAPFSLLSLSYRDAEVEGGTVRSRARTRKQLGTIAKALGYKIRWVADKPYNAKIDTDEKVLSVNIRTDRPLESVIGHEITHDLRKSDPKAYEMLKRYAQDLLGQAQWDNEVKDVTDTYNEEYKRRGWEPIRADKAEEEVVCDTMGKVLHTRKGLRELAGSLDTTVAGKVYRLLKDITDKVKSALGKEHDYETMDMALNEFLESVEQRAKKGIHLDPSGGYSVTDKAEIESMAPRMEGESEAAYNERIGEIEADEKAFVDGDGQFSLKRDDRNAPTFYSNAAKAVENVKQNKATAEQWKAMLTKAGGIKAGEDKWMGLSQWLDEHKGQTLTKEEVAQFVADNGIEMREVNYEEHPSQRTNTADFFMFTVGLTNELIDLHKTKNLSAEEAFQDIIERYGPEALDYVHLEDPGLIRPNKYIDEKEALAFFGQQVKEDEIFPIDSTRLDYTTDGLENKREIAFVVPNVEPYQETDEIHFGPENQGRAVMWVRFGETTDADGNRVLVIDEIQSNRHQDAREKGYMKDPIESLKENGLGIRETVGEKGEDRYEIYWLSDGRPKGSIFKGMDGINDVNSAAKYMLRTFFVQKLNDSVPAAPFEKNWHELAMKRMLRYAAENGYDKIAWTTGMQQADRYSLSHAVQSIAFNPEEDGSHSVFVTMQGGTMYEMVVGTDGMIESTRGNMFNGKNAVEVFGKEITDKIMNAEEPAELTGDDLRVGGYGMKSFYDGILPQYMNKYGKKWGVKVGEVTLNTPGRETMHSVDINEDMRRSVVEQGQPLFSLKREDSQKVFDTAKRKFGETKDIREAGYVLPDGSMLDFSGRHELDPGTDSSFLAGRRSTDHRAVNQISFVYDENGDEVDTGVSSDMPDFIKRGAIRIDNNAGSINLSAAPTSEQKKVLRELIRRNRGDVQVDFGDGWNSDHYVEYEEASAQRVLGDIDRYFDEGIKPEGNVRFSLKRETRTDADGNEVYTETREDGTKDREITTYSDGSKKALWYDDAGVLKERLDYYPNGEVSQVANYDYAGELTRHIQYDENRRTTSYYLPAIGTDWKLDENGIARGKSNGVEIKPYNFQFSLKREQTHSDNFKRWFGDWENDPENASKVVDDQGRPLVVYHQTNAKRWINRETGEDWEKLDWRKKMEWENKSQEEWEDAWEEQDFYTFDDRYARQSIEMPAIFFSPENDPHHEYGNRTIAVYLNMRNPAINPDIPNRGVTDTAGRDAMEALKAQGYDGFIRTDEDGNIREYGVFDSNQVKSATENNGDFDPNNPDIRFSLKRRRNRDDYTDEDRADAAIIANTYLAQADALRQQIEADREREHQLVEERNKLLAFEYPAADPADRPAIMDRINALRNQINDLRNANYENNTKLRSMDYEYRVAKEILEQGAVTDEEASRFDAGQMTREEQVLESLFKAAADSRADKKAKQKAVRGLVRELVAITDNFKAAMKARGIESQRKHYDKGTVDHIIRLARAMMGTGYIDNMTSYEVKRLMGMINNAATRESIEEQAGRIVDMMLDHQIRTLRNDFDKQLRVTGQNTNSSGVQVQAGLDQEGQVVMEAMRKSMQIIADSAGERYDGNGYLTEWGEFYEKTLNDMGDADPVKAEQARKIFEGVWLASKWYEDVRTMEINGRILRSQMEDFKASNKPAKDADKDTKQRYNDVLADYQEMLRQNKIKIIEAYERMTGDVGMTQAESVRRAKEFAEAQKQRVNEIQHNANSDLADVDDNTQVETPESRVFGANKNNVLARLLFASAGTYEKFMRFFGRMAPNGEGYLFKRFMTQYHHARQNYWKGRHSAFEEMDKKMAEVFGKKNMHWSDIYEMVRDHKKFPTITVSYWDGYRNGQPFRREDELNQSEALYLYMINKMPDGRMKLRHMGITDDVVQQMAGQINNKLIQLADWLQSEFLPKMRVKYNETHKRVFGADMAAIEDYFPLRVNKLSVASDMDITERDMNDNKPSTITGAIVKRRVNTLPIDLHTDAFDVALSHIDEMEHWSAFAEFNRDNNTLVNYKRFRTKVNNMRSLELGAGDVLWKNFTDAVAIAADAYHPRAGSRSGDHYSTRVAKFVSTAKIALRPYTALKQLLSIPAFWADSDPLEQFKATVDVANTWQWAIENLPGFAERWQSRQAGNIKLANYNDLSGLRRRKAMQKLGRMGMWANAAIDGLACAMGGKAVYETKLKRYRKMGYDEARAQEKALIDAAIAYNNSQQSSEGAYVSPLQVDRTWFANAFSVFRSASMGYTRRMNTSLRQLRNATFKPGYGAQSVEFLKKQMMRDGLSEEQATKWAHRIYRRANLKAAASVAIFGQILPFTWNLGANMFYLLFGDDDKEKLKILADSFRHSFFGPVEGLVGGNVISELGDIAADTAIGKIWGDGIWGDSNAFKTLGYRDFSTMPLSSDINNVLKYFARDEVKAANEVVNILFQVATGVNPQTITDWATAILDLSRSDMERRDIAMFVMRMLSTPQQQLDKFYLDQMNLTQEQAAKMSKEDLIKRYATYKRWRETPLTGWMYSDEREKKVEEKFQKRYEEMLEERATGEDGLRESINTTDDLPSKRTKMRKLQKELTDSTEAADPELYKKALEGEKADDDEYVRHVTDKDVEQMAELAMKKKALRAAYDRKKQADKDRVAGRINKEEYDAIYKECAHEWKLYNYLNSTLPKKLKKLKRKMEPGASKHNPEYWMDSIRTLTDEALQKLPEDMKMKKADKKHYQKKDKNK